jgi:RNA polymerase sigma-70 factor (ECF subfamily)
MQTLPLRWPLVLSVAAGAARAPRGRIEPTESDGDLVRRARRGDRWAEEALYHRHVRVVTRVVLRLLARSAEAEDVVQDAFLTALAELGKLRDEDAFGGWLLTIAVRQVRRRFRTRRLLRTLGLDRGVDDYLLSMHVDPGVTPDVAAALSEVDRLVATLPARPRIAWTLRYVEGYELREVAKLCGCSLATVKRLIAQAQTVVSAHVRPEELETEAADA